jgi:hypothetical protein
VARTRADQLRPTNSLPSTLSSLTVSLTSIKMETGSDRPVSESNVL